MFRLVVGLGNPGKKYEKTRHNAGFWFVDSLANQIGNEWALQSRFQGLVSTGFCQGCKIFLLKPETYMNKSGLSVVSLMRYYDIQLENLLVVHDELDFEPGLVKFKRSGGHAGHNGLRDIIAHLGSREFARLRIGVGRPVVPGANVADYVLNDPSKIERQKIDQAIESVLDCKDLLLFGEADKLMNKLH